ncbi:MAG TPA: 2-phosphosulfolactate phosphatase [Thermotogota bacterium]|nr:2-phosphosulfolactate phosphatase [Thermotogota bacterium]HRW34364.1 2-phosphosulfolactate phosphatase [Thermotogota bacterium]
MNVTVIPYYSEIFKTDDLQRYDALFLIDVYRATSSMVVMKSRGAKTIKVVATIEQAFEERKENPDFLLCGERDSVKPEGFDYGNDTSILNEVDFTRKTCVITTSNGTRALKAYSSVTTNFFACSVLNINACIENICVKGYQNILVLCAGNWSQFSLEDYLCATLLLQGLADNHIVLNDEIRLALDVGQFYKDNPDSLKSALITTKHAEVLKQNGKYQDVLFIVQNINAFNCLPKLY